MKTTNWTYVEDACNSISIRDENLNEVCSVLAEGDELTHENYKAANLLVQADAMRNVLEDIIECQRKDDTKKQGELYEVIREILKNID